MNTRLDLTVPRCPGCKGRHYPATLGDGRSAWCGDKPGTTYRAPALSHAGAYPDLYEIDPTGEYHLRLRQGDRS